ncbi:histidine phosphatase family protein [Ilumatobacter sp.]|uniref:histidine phosphatase family protein n=1 Tax=Ilumatobacter sp. TaxID=1967498 RepID=UPI003751BA40
MADQSTKPATRLVLVRHGESQVTVNRVIGGYRTCSGLSELGREQSGRLRDRLSSTGELEGGVLIASNFARALETARIFGPAMGAAEPIEIAGFGEHDPGPDLDGVTFAAYVEQFGSPNFGGDPHFDVFPGGETVAAFHLRVGSALARVLDERAGQLIVVSCHGGVVDAIFRQLLRAAPTGIFDLWTTNASITEFVLSSDSAARDQRWRLVRYNDAAHLAGLPRATDEVKPTEVADQTAATGAEATGAEASSRI